MLIFCTGGSKAIPHNSRLTAQAPLWRLRHGICVAKMLDNVGLRYPHRASGAKAPRTLRLLPLLRFAVSATGGAHLCSIQYYLRFWLSSCRTSLAVSALSIMRYCPRLFNAKSGCVCRNRRYFRLFRYTLAQRRNFPSFRSCIRINSSIIHKYSKSMHKYWIQHFAARWLPAPPEIVHFSSLHFTVFPDILTP